MVWHTSINETINSSDTVIREKNLRDPDKRRDSLLLFLRTENLKYTYTFVDRIPELVLLTSYLEYKNNNNNNSTITLGYPLKKKINQLNKHSDFYNNNIV